MAIGNFSVESLFRYSYFFSLIGAYPLRYYNKKFSFSPYLFLVNILVVFLSLCLVIDSILYSNTNHNSAPRTLYAMSTTSMLLVILITLYQFSWNHQIYSELSLRLLNLENYTISSISCLLPAFIIVLQVICTLVKCYFHSWTTFICYEILIFQTFVVVLQFSIILTTLGNHLDYLTKFLDSSTTERTKILPILEHHNIILDCCSSLNSLYGQQFLFIVFSEFLILVCVIQANTQFFYSGDGKIFSDFLVWIVTPLVHTFYLVSSCTSITVKDEKFTSKLRQLSIKRDLDDPNLMFAALTTYVMLLTQWSSVDKN